ncbi:hypothetical protein Tco_0666469, partial [Tanacetum coccineum]
NTLDNILYFDIVLKNLEEESYDRETKNSTLEKIKEMLRIPLVELCLQINLLSLGGIMPSLQKALEPPMEEAITSAVSLLYEGGDVDGDEELRPFVYHLAKLPVDVLIGKICTLVS